MDTLASASGASAEKTWTRISSAASAELAIDIQHTITDRMGKEIRTSDWKNIDRSGWVWLSS
jgi:hypothetical protein